MTIRLNESTSGVPVTSKGNGVFEVRLIQSGWGSSGYYSESLLEEFGPATFTKNRPMFANHPTGGDSTRDVRDIMGKLTSDAEYRDGSLFAEIKVDERYAAFVDEYKDVIGLSIHASGSGSKGEIDGREGLLVEEFNTADPYTSVDFVVAAGAGGKVERMLESAKTIFAEATSNDRREELQALLGQTIDGNTGWVYVRDFDDANVWYDVDGEVFQQTYSVTGDIATALEGEAVQVRAKTQYVPVNTVRESAEPTVEKEVKMDKELVEEFGEIKTAIAGLAAALQAAVPEPTKPEAVDVAAVVESAIEAGLPKSARSRVVASVQGGTSLEEALKSETDALAEYKTLFESKDSDEAPGRLVEGAGKVDWNPGNLSFLRKG
jgi:hypothetical protein